MLCFFGIFSAIPPTDSPRFSELDEDVGLFNIMTIFKLIIPIEKHICLDNPRPIHHFRDRLPTLPLQFFMLISVVRVLF